MNQRARRGTGLLIAGLACLLVFGASRILGVDTPGIFSPKSWNEAIFSGSLLLGIGMTCTGLADILGSHARKGAETWVALVGGVSILAFLFLVIRCLLLLF
jgi:hypothetical protein